MPIILPSCLTAPRYGSELGPNSCHQTLSQAGNTAFIVRGQDGGLTAYGGSVQWIFDDEADVSIGNATEPFLGTYRPIGELSLFDKQDAYGTCRLRIYDAFQADVGVLESFEIVIETPEPATSVFFVLGAGLVSLLRPQRWR